MYVDILGCNRNNIIGFSNDVVVQRNVVCAKYHILNYQNNSLKVDKKTDMYVFQIRLNNRQKFFFLVSSVYKSQL